MISTFLGDLHNHISFPVAMEHVAIVSTIASGLGSLASTGAAVAFPVVAVAPPAAIAIAGFAMSTLIGTAVEKGYKYFDVNNKLKTFNQNIVDNQMRKSKMNNIKVGAY